MALETYDQPMPMSVPLIAMFWHRRAEANPAQAFLRRRIAGLLGALNAGEDPV